MSGHRTPSGCVVVLIGDFEQSAALQQCAELLERDIGQACRAFPTLSQAWTAGLGTRLLPALVVVAQSWSDEFTAEDVGLLIGQVPSARIVCCYGPWCASDGRTHAAWPVACRVSVDAVVEVICDWLTSSRMIEHLPDRSHQRDGWSPLMAAEDVFAVSGGEESRREQIERSAGRKPVFIETSDRALRSTIEEICATSGWELCRAQHSACDDSAIVVRDLDDAPEYLMSSSRPGAVIGITAFADRDVVAHHVRAILPKLELARLLPPAIRDAGR